MSLALARKYRPSSFDALVGQESVSQTLSLALDSDKLSHAYLFSGLRGSGKTSTARIFAKALLCEIGASSHPCDKCDNCTMANESRHMDIIEMDAASNRGIDDIKELIEHTKYKPSISRYKIFIIDEVHMLTTQAFNALLKTLEEPPSFVKFILATTDPLKLPATILSRTQHFRFKKIPQKLVLGHLEFILNKEGISYEKEALDIIARSGAGSLRDSLTLLDQAIVYSKNYIDMTTVTNMLGIIEPSMLDKLLDHIATKDESGILEFISLASEYESEMIIDELTLYLKELLFAKDHRFAPLIIDRFFRILADAKELLSIGSEEEFVLLLTLFKMMEALSVRDIDDMIHTLQKELSGVAVKTPEKEVEIPNIELNNHSSDETKTPTEQEKETANTTQQQSAQDSIDTGALKFKSLVSKIYDRDYDLGQCFESNIRYESFMNNKLTWHSTAESDEKKLLVKHWSIIKMFVQELFGIEAKIVNIQSSESKKKIKTKGIKQATNDSIQSKEDNEQRAVNAFAYDQKYPNATHSENMHNDTDTTSTIEDTETKSSGRVPHTNNSEVAKKKDPSELLQEPMIKEMIELFDPKKVRIRRKNL